MFLNIAEANTKSLAMIQRSLPKTAISSALRRAPAPPSGFMAFAISKRRKMRRAPEWMGASNTKLAQELSKQWDMLDAVQKAKWKSTAEDGFATKFAVSASAASAHAGNSSEGAAPAGTVATVPINPAAAGVTAIHEALLPQSLLAAAARPLQDSAVPQSLALGGASVSTAAAGLAAKKAARKAARKATGEMARPD